MSVTKIRGSWPVPVKEEPPVEGVFKVVQVPYTYTPQAKGISIYQAEIEALLKGEMGKTAIECKEHAKAKRLVTAVQRRINNLKKGKALRVVTRRTDGVTLVWVVKREKA